MAMLDAETINRIEESQKAEADDRAYFERNPDRELRLRRAHACEVSGLAPAGYAVFVILHRFDVAESHMHVFFGRRSNFNAELSDAEIRELL